jgi:hypothetical protein
LQATVPASACATLVKAGLDRRLQGLRPESCSCTFYTRTWVNLPRRTFSRRKRSGQSRRKDGRAFVGRFRSCPRGECAGKEVVGHDGPARIGSLASVGDYRLLDSKWRPISRRSVDREERAKTERDCARSRVVLSRRILCCSEARQALRLAASES